MISKALALLKEHAAQAIGKPAYWSDVAYALTELREAMPAMPSGRVEMLNDLQRRALAAESTHDPAVVSDLLQALTAFLDEEMNEALRAETAAPTEGNTTMTETDRRRRAEADEYRRYAADPESPAEAFEAAWRAGGPLKRTDNRPDAATVFAEGWSALA